MVQQQQKTIIITTHYIEEANEANDVSLYRHICIHVLYTVYFYYKRNKING